MTFDQLSPFTIIVSFVVYIVISIGYYSPIFLGKTWLKYKGLSETEIQNSYYLLSLSALGGFVGVGILVVLSHLLNVENAFSGALLGFVLVIFGLTISWNNLLYDKQSTLYQRLRVYIIEAFHSIIAYSIIGALIGLLN